MRLFGRFRWEITVMLEYEFASLYAAAIMVFAALVPVLNPFGGAMFFLTLTNGVDPHVRASMANQIGLYSIIVLLVCLFAGNIILNFFGISIGVLRMAGGIVLFSAGWQALNAPPQDDGAPAGQPKSARVLSTMAFYPFTLPLTTGPGAISVAVALGATPYSDVGQLIGTIVGIALSILLVWVCYRYCDRITRAVGAAGADALVRIFSFILICLGVSTFWHGFSELWAQLPKV